jgi:pimeloyl-ACP methyl ester carboxylesterase
MPPCVMKHDIAVTIAVFVAAAFAVGVVGYVAVSFRLMRAHVAGRSTAAALREALREVFWATVSQPLLPLFYAVGRRMGSGGGDVPVVCVHGYMQNRVDFIALARQLGRSGAGDIYGFNYPWFDTVEKNAARLSRFVEAVRRERGVARVDIVAHSLGGIVTMKMLQDGGDKFVRKVVTIASPHGGVAWTGPIPGACGPHLRASSAIVLGRSEERLSIPCLSVYSTHDNVVHPPETSSLVKRGGSDVAIGGVGHLSILFSREAMGAVSGFLRADL